MLWPWYFLIGLTGVTLIVIPAVNADVLSKQLFIRLSKFTSMPDYIFFSQKKDTEMTIDEYIENTEVSLMSYVLAIMAIFLVLFILYSIIAFDGLYNPATGATPIRMVIEATLQAGLIFLLTGVGIQDVNSRLIYTGIIFLWTLTRIGSPLSSAESPRIFFTVVAELRIIYIIYIMIYNSPRKDVDKYKIKAGSSEIDGTFNAFGTYGLACALIMAYLVIGDAMDIIGINGPVQISQPMPPTTDTRIAEAIVLALNDFWILIVVPLVVSDRYRFLNYEGMFAKIEQYSSTIGEKVGSGGQWIRKRGQMPLFL